jgi:hypothetical protein
LKGCTRGGFSKIAKEESSRKGLLITAKNLRSEISLRGNNYWHKAKGALKLSDAMMAERDNTVIQIESSDHEPLQMRLLPGQISKRYSLYAFTLKL